MKQKPKADKFHFNASFENSTRKFHYKNKTRTNKKREKNGTERWVFKGL